MIFREPKTLRNVTLLSVEIDKTGFASTRIRDNDTGDVYTVPCGYVLLTERPGHPHGLCGEWWRHEPHLYPSETLGTFWCTGDPADREPARSQRAQDAMRSESEEK